MYFLKYLYVMLYSSLSLFLRNGKALCDRYISIRDFHKWHPHISNSRPPTHYPVFILLCYAAFNSCFHLSLPPPVQHMWMSYHIGLSLSKSKITDYVNAGGNARNEGEMKTALDSGKGSVRILKNVIFQREKQSQKSSLKIVHILRTDWLTEWRDHLQPSCHQKVTTGQCPRCQAYQLCRDKFNGRLTFSITLSPLCFPFHKTLKKREK